MNTMQVTEALAGIIDAMRADSYEVEVVDATQMPSRCRSRPATAHARTASRRHRS